MHTKEFVKLTVLAMTCWIDCESFSTAKGRSRGARFLSPRSRISPPLMDPLCFGLRMKEVDSEQLGAMPFPLIALSDEESLVLPNPKPVSPLSVSFSHIHLFVDHLESLDVYKEIEKNLNEYHSQSYGLNKERKRQLWVELCGSAGRPFAPHNRDIVKQMMIGFGFRVTGHHFPSENNPSDSRSILVTSKDPNGIQILVTTAGDGLVGKQSDFVHFDPAYHREFYRNHGNRQGVAVLGFHAEDISPIQSRYQKLHPHLIQSFREHLCENQSTTKILQVFAYYNQTDQGKCADRGTMLRFIQSSYRDSSVMACPLPGLESVTSTFDSASFPAYCDHWVSNVYSRTDFCNTLEDVLGFGPKVDFNAGVIAAGEAQIESTVIGNTSPFETGDKREVLTDQSQVFLPINNALSEVGHVYGFLKEMGQGIQHCASRVEDLVSFVQQCNEMREITEEGFSFLDIPRSYYGVLTADYLMKAARISEQLSQEVMLVCTRTGIIREDGSVDLSMTHGSLCRKFDSEACQWAQDSKEAFLQHKGDIARAILSSRYCNMYPLIGDRLAEEQYLGIVRNKILIDTQGPDVLYQIFTCNILQRNPGEEAPFFEFIQRVCSPNAAKVKPGCGGFGIRNFLTLFLSIEINRAVSDTMKARLEGDGPGALYAEKRVKYFTNQLNEANPVLTAISDAMLEEGECKVALDALMHDDGDDAKRWKQKLKRASQRKEIESSRLMKSSARYARLMKELRESYVKSSESR